MTLLAPWALWLALVALPIGALYLLRIRRTRQVVPALEFWQALADTSRVRSLFDRLKRLLSLLLWLFIAACLLLAVGNPVLSLGSIRAQSIVLIVDNSASMQAREGAEEDATRLAQARDAIRRMTMHRPVSDEWLLIEAGRTLRVAQSWTRDGALVRQAASTLEPHLGSTSLDEAVRLARQLLAGRRDSVVVVLSDGNNGELSSLARDDDDLVVWPIGSTSDNVGITDLSVRLHQQRAAHYVYARVVNASDTEVEANLVLSLDGITTAVEPLRLDPGAAWEKTLLLEHPQGGVLHASIDRSDALAADNDAFAVLAPIRPARVLLVSRPEEAFFVQQAIAAMTPVVDLEGSASIPPERFSPEVVAEVSPDLVVFNNWAPQTLPPGASICLNDWPADVAARDVGVVEHPRLIVEEQNHPLMSFINLRGASIAAAREIELMDRSTVLVRGNEGQPLIFVAQQPGRQALCIAFDVLASDLPFRNGFPLLLRNAVGHMVSQQRAWVKDQYAVGEVIRPLRDLPDSLHSVQVVRPGVTEEQIQATLEVQNGTFEFRETTATGPIRFDLADESAYAAVNVASDMESRIACVSGVDDPAQRLGLSRSILGRTPWFVLAVAALGLITLEWMTYHLRWTE